MARIGYGCVSAADQDPAASALASKRPGASRYSWTRTRAGSRASRASVADRSASPDSGLPPGEARGFAKSGMCHHSNPPVLVAVVHWTRVGSRLPTGLLYEPAECLPDPAG
jgi:hypothetical protein